VIITLIVEISLGLILSKFGEVLSGFHIINELQFTKCVFSILNWVRRSKISVRISLNKVQK